jgi:hypothetical protein
MSCLYRYATCWWLKHGSIPQCHQLEDGQSKASEAKSSITLLFSSSIAPPASIVNALESRQEPHCKSKYGDYRRLEQSGMGKTSRRGGNVLGRSAPGLTLTAPSVKRKQTSVLDRFGG